ncbi:histone acetyltransferase HPA2-like acetyltransferase [Streptococcus varani]|uniref:Histone acetyltransferase HPA2-like acetyltransferase n=1 Tax=Streptococcus varani TaxID=1608583 RepID=A0A0E4H4P4_9STRE|nr:GNAT family N-acetyltransferase [Streptococcus varani]CQR24732.1 histone acetyltransferase HPA2-like acetyltransferase [Streptococcus varani]
MEIRLAHPNELGQITSILEEAKAFLAASVSSQWQGENGYPNQEDVFEDIIENRAYVGLMEGKVVAYAAVYLDNQAEYNAIYDGKWKHDNYLYVTFHRIAVSNQYRGQQVVQTFLQGLIEGHKGPDFRCDTHELNKPMQHILEKLGFVYCGKVPIDGERLAYQKIKHKSETSLYQEI